MPIIFFIIGNHGLSGIQGQIHPINEKDRPRQGAIMSSFVHI
jgi:hypothetical protein